MKDEKPLDRAGLAVGVAGRAQPVAFGHDIALEPCFHFGAQFFNALRLRGVEAFAYNSCGPCAWR